MSDKERPLEGGCVPLQSASVAFLHVNVLSVLLVRLSPPLVESCPGKEYKYSGLPKAGDYPCDPPNRGWAWGEG